MAAADPDAQNSPGDRPWLRPAPGAEGASHDLALMLVRYRQAHTEDEGAEAGVISLDELEAFITQVDPEAISDLAQDLVKAGMAVEREQDGGPAWRATDDLVAALG